jgi:MGT family glycosyltransferase
VRTSDASFEIPEGLRDGEGGLIYLSLGSLGSADVDLMRRLVEVLGEAPHRFIVSKGPQHDLYDLAPNMWGEEFVPQPSILPQVDLVITHAGNNTTTECMHFGKPMIALPLFWDQYDNAQRVDETGFGVRLRTYAFEPEEMTGAIDRLLGDAALRGRLDAVAARLQAGPGTVTAADQIERVAVAG